MHHFARPSPTLKETGGRKESINDALLWTAARPGKGIVRNAVLFAASFAVMMFAPLTPYITVGAFIVSMMLLRKQKYFMYFFQPADVKDMTFMVYKFTAKDDDRWLFVPAINMVRRIAAQDKRSSFVDSDFTYEDVSGRDIEDDTHALAKEEKLGAQDCYVIMRTPKAADVDYSYKLSWIDKTNYLPLKEEYYDKRAELYKVFTADELKDIKGFPIMQGFFI